MKNRKWLWILRGILMAVAFAVIVGALVMILWNNVMTAIFTVPAITFGQAIGILVLAKILFGGWGWWGRRGCGHRGRWHYKMHERWHNMTPEEREKWKNEWRSYCGSRGYDDNPETADKPVEKA